MKTTIIRVLRAVADALEGPPAATPSRRTATLAIEDAPPGTEAPEPFVLVKPGDNLDQANALLARIFLARALTRFSPAPKYHA